MTSNINKELNRIIDNYSVLSIDDKIIINKNVSPDVAWLLYSFAIMMSTYSLRFSEQQKFTNGLQAMRMIFNVIDQRDILVIMPLYYDVTIRNKLSFKEILVENDDFASFVNKFIGREAEDKTLACMGYLLTTDENNDLIYKRTW